MSVPARGRRSLGFLLRESSLMLRRRFVHHARKAGLPLNRSEASLLWHVSHEPGIIQAAVAHHLDMETISVARLVDGLERAGLLERRAHAVDRRMRTLWLTETGDAAVARIRGINEIVRAEALDGMPAPQREALLDLLLMIRTNLAQVTETERSNAA
ncbi:MAG TPA: MarR family winged helix-turn-helix transcriptional regulator [Acetobacteraceae bacterium]|jgi:MarR family transcriptional regulator for hemolysin|nr:MarR family winged helix-turn-helix transcriptional regulator [Acetobacteraceae bacterium]